MTFVATGVPLCSAGVNLHCLTASTTASAKARSEADLTVDARGVARRVYDELDLDGLTDVVPTDVG